MRFVTIALKHATLDYTEKGAVTTFRDGTRWGALPHDKPHYHAISHRLGYNGDILLYAQEHELAHHLVAEAFGRPSLVIWKLAHGEKPDPYEAAAEEALAMALQRYARTNEAPLIEGVEWDDLKCRMLLAEELG